MTRVEYGSNNALPDPEFQSELDQMVRLLKYGGCILIFRNRFPRALLGERALYVRGARTHVSDELIRRDWEGLVARGTALRCKQDRVTLVIPARELDWFLADPALLSGTIEAAGLPLLSSSLSEIAGEILERFSTALRWFEPENGLALSFASATALERSVSDDLGFDNTIGLPLTNYLPNVWLAFSKPVVGKLGGIVGTGERGIWEHQFVEYVRRLASCHELTGRDLPEALCQECGDLVDWVAQEQLSIVRVSGAEFNPRFMGERVRSERDARRLLIHCALAYLYSRPALP